MTRRNVLIPLVLLAACADAPPPAPPPPDQPQRVGDAAGPLTPDGSGDVQLRRQVAGVERRARLHQVEGGWRLDGLSPAPRGALEPAALEWIFCALPTHADLHIPDGRRLDHPDRARLSELLRGASAPDVDLSAAVREVPRLLRCESRAQLLTRLAAREPLTADQLGFLVDFATGEPGSGLLQPDPSGTGPGGDAPGALAAALAALADRLDLDRAKSDQIARASQRVGRDSLVLDLLERLVRNGRAGVPALVEAALIGLNEPASRGAVLLLLARKRTDAGEQLELCRAAPRLGAEGNARALLVDLAARGAPVQGVLNAARQALPGPTDRQPVLLALARRRELTLAEVRLVGDAAVEMGPDGLEQEVLVALAAHPGSTAAVLASADHGLHGSPARGHLLLALARRDEHAPGELAQILVRVPWINHDAQEAQVLVSLVRAGVPTDQILAAWRRALVVPASRAEVLRALAEGPGRPQAELDLITRAVPEVGEDEPEESLLVALGGGGIASANAVVTATASALNGFTARSHVLEALARRRDLPTDEANLVAAATPRLLDGGRAVPVLVLLIGKASREALLSASELLSDPDHRALVLAALEKSRGS